jgi:peptidoglycan hydrolase-like protein with peptidoglycan-binding domain
MLLSFSRQRKAIEYNRRREFGDALIKNIQHLMGVANDGIIGRKTVEAIAFWQQNNNLVVDGKIGPYTLAALEASLEDNQAPVFLVQPTPIYNPSSSTE